MAMTEHADPANDPGRRRRRSASCRRRERPQRRRSRSASGGHIRVGTASWTDPTMTASGVFYPRRRRQRRGAARSTTPRRSRSSRSTPPTTPCRRARTAELWVDRTPPDFTFDIKAHALMTGQGTETKRLPKAIRDGAARTRWRRRRGSTPRTCRRSSSTRSGRCSGTASSRSRERGQLGSILLQYPNWFFPSSENRAAIEDAVERLDGMTLRGRVPQRLVAQREERRADARASSRTRNIAVRHGRRAAGLQEQRPAGRPR